MDKIPYWNGTDDGVALYDTEYFRPRSPGASNDDWWTNHRQAESYGITDLSLRTTRDDAAFWVRTKD